MTLVGALTGSTGFDVERALAAEHGGGRPQGRGWRGSGVVLGCGPWGQLAVLGPDLAAVADARIDNRDALIRTLAVTDDPPPSDAQLLLWAWRRWDDDFLDRVHGDIACALWDGTRRRLVLGRDAMGFRPLHYCRSGDRWLFSSMPAGLLTDAAVPNEPDELFLAEALVQLDHRGSASPYRSIERVPPGHLVVIEGDRVRSHRHWRPERIGTLRLPRNQDYADAVRSCLEEAVRCRLPANGPVGSELSSGLDSTAVTSLAARQLAAQGRTIVAYTAVPADPVDDRLYPGRIPDEGPLAALVAARYPNIDHVRIPSNGGRGLFSVNEARTLAGGEMTGLWPNGIWADGICEHARRRGIRTVLVGGFGNITVSYHGLPLLPDLARRGQLGALVGHWRGLRRWEPGSWSWARLLYQTVGPLLPGAVVSALRRARGRVSFQTCDLYGINPAFARETGVEARLKERECGLPANGRSWRMDMLAGDMGSAVATRRLHGLVAVDPTADRRLVELCLSIPEDQFLHRGEPRALLRRVMAGIVPDEILFERRSGMQSADWPARYTEARADFVAELARLEASPLARRVLDLPRLRLLVDAWPAADAGTAWHGADLRNKVMLVLAQSFGAALFLRQFERGNFP